MEAIIAGGLLLAGAKFADLKTTKNEDLKVDKLKSIRDPNGLDVYESRDYDAKYRDLFARAYVRRQDSKKTSKTGMIPPEYNRQPKDEHGDIIDFGADQDPSDLLTVDNMVELIETGARGPNRKRSEAEDFLGTELKITDNLTNEEKFFRETINDSSYVEQFQPLKYDNPSSPSASNAVSQSTSRLRMLDTERDMQMKQGWSSFNKGKNMTYNVTPAKNFVHNNMVPYFSKGSYGYNYGGYDNVKQQKLETFTGSSNQAGFSHKKEVKPFFDPVMGLTNIYGMPTVTGVEKDRYAMSLVDERKRQSEMPFDPIRVNTGLDLDYYEHGEDGFQPWYRPFARGVDELRTANKPKLPLGNVVIPGMKGQGKRGIQAPVNKNRPETFYENDPEDLLRTYGYIQAPTVRGNYYMPTTLKEQTIGAYAGNPYGAQGQTIDQNMPEGMFPKIRLSDKNIYDTLPLQQKFGNWGIQRSNHQIGQNERTTTQYSHYSGLTGNMKALGKGFVVDPKDLPKITTKQTTLYEQQKFGIIGGSGGAQNKGTYAHDPKDVLRTTNKETIEDTKFLGILGPEYKHGYVYDPKDVPRTTLKETLVDKTVQGNLIGAIVGALKPSDRPKTTTKETTIDTKYSAALGTGINKGPAFDPKDVLRTTVKETTLDPKYIGGLSGTNIQNQGGYQYTNWEAPTTLRQVHGNAKQAGTISGSAVQNQGGYQYTNWEAPTTLRQVHGDAKQAGTISGSTVQNHGGYQFENFDPKVTLRQVHGNAKQAGTISGSAVQNQGGYQYTNWEAPTTLKELVENSKQGGYMGNVQNKSGQESNKWYAPVTIKQGTTNIMYMGGAPDGLTHTGYQSNKWYAPVTTKQGLVNYFHIGQPGATVSEHQVYEPFYNMTFDDRKEIANMSGRMPTLSNYNKIPDTRLTEYKLKNDIDRIIYRDVMPEAYVYNPNQQVLPGCFTQVNQYLPQENQRVDPALVNQLSSNPYHIPIIPTDCSQPVAGATVQNPMQSYGYTQYYNPYGQQQATGGTIYYQSPASGMPQLADGAINIGMYTPGVTEPQQQLPY